jgi:Sulfotransferase domain
MSQSKIFGIGLSKTGTTSLCEALRILGYSTIDFPVGLIGVEEHDAATDAPIADNFELLDRRYHGSKFIYTVRQRDDWLRSCRTYWARRIDRDRETRQEVVELYERIYQSVDFDENLFRHAYDKHEMRVLSYFANRHHDLLIIDICSGEGDWQPLCSFLGKEIPDRKFPHLNKKKTLIKHYLDTNSLLRQAIHSRILRKGVKKTKKRYKLFSSSAIW